MLQPAGYRPAGAWVRAGGGWSAGRGRFCWTVLRSVRARFEVLARRLVFDLCPACVSIGMFCVHSRLLCGSGAASCVRSMPGVRFYWNVLCSFTPAVCRMAPNRTACGMLRSSSAVGRDRWACVLESLVRFSRMVGLIWACAFPYGDPDGETKGRRERSRRRGRVRFCVIILALRRFPRGVRWGYAPQTCAKETRLPGLSSFDSRRGRVLRGDGHSGITKTRPAPMSGGRTGRVVYQ